MWYIRLSPSPFRIKWEFFKTFFILINQIKLNLLLVPVAAPIRRRNWRLLVGGIMVIGGGISIEGVRWYGDCGGLTIPEKKIIIRSIQKLFVADILLLKIVFNRSCFVRSLVQDFIKVCLCWYFGELPLSTENKWFYYIDTKKYDFILALYI